MFIFPHSSTYRELHLSNSNHFSQTLGGSNYLENTVLSIWKHASTTTPKIVSYCKFQPTVKISLRKCRNARTQYQIVFTQINFFSMILTKENALYCKYQHRIKLNLRLL